MKHTQKNASSAHEEILLKTNIHCSEDFLEKITPAYFRLRKHVRQ